MRTNDFMVVGIGASAGGLDARRNLFEPIPTDIPACFVVVTHLMRSHRSELASIISRFTKLKVERMTGIALAEPGMIFVQPENTHVRIRRAALTLSIRPPHQTNHAIDFFFHSLAIDQGENAIGVVLAGMGDDGSDGAKYLHDHGATVFVQAPSTTSFESMPCATIMKDHPGFVLPPAELGLKLTTYIQSRVGQPMQKALRL